MSAQRFSSGTRFRWQDNSWEVKRLLPDDKVNIENILTGATLIVEQRMLIEALFDDKLWFAIEGKQARRLTQDGLRLASEYADWRDCPPHLRAIAEYRLEVIRPLLDLAPGTRTRAVVEARVLEVREAHKNQTADQPELGTSVSTTSVYGWIKDYLRSNRDPRSLIPDTTKRGGKGGSRLDSETNAIIEAVINDRYYARELVTIETVFNEVAVRVDEENRLRPAMEKLTMPAQRTVARRIAALDASARLTAKRGKRAAKRELAQYGQMTRPTVPLERTEIDHTPSDVIALDDRDNLPLGRPTLTYCLDRATGYPLGIYLGFEPPSYLAVMECLYHTIRPKENTREKYGTEHDWIAHGIPSTLVTDNGKEFTGVDLKDACHLLGVVLEQMPVATPYFKPGVERIFRTTNTMLLHTLPGTTFSNPKQRGDYDSVGQSVVWLSELEQMLNLYVVDIYAERFHRGIDGIPARRWAEATRSGFFSPRLPPNAEELSILLGRVEERVIHHYGIEFESIRYNSANLGPLRGRLKGGKAKFKYHPADLSRIYVFDPFADAQSDRYIEVPALDQEYTQGLSLWKHRVIRNAVLSEQDRVDPVALGKARRKIQAIVDTARARKHMSTRSKIARWDSGGRAPSLAGRSETQPAIPALPPPVQALPSAQPPTTEAQPDDNTDEVFDYDYQLPAKR